MTQLNRAAAAAAVVSSVLFAPAAKAAPPVAPVVPVVPSFPVQVGNDKDAEALKRQLEESDRKLSAIQNQLKQLAELLNGRRDSDGFLIPNTGLLSEMKSLKDRLDKVEKDLDGMRKTQTSLRPESPPAGGGTGSVVDPRPARGTIRVVNEYPVQVSIVVNGTSYRVAPSKTLDIDVGAGEFSYQLLESGAAPTRSVIKDKETVTLRIK